MRLPTVLLKARSPQSEKLVPFQAILPMRLKGQVSGKSNSQAEVACLQEIAVLLACMKAADFSETICAKEIGVFKTCYKSFLDHKTATKKAQESGNLTPGANLNYKQLNKLMKKYPGPK